jgi:predicted peptidase
MAQGRPVRDAGLMRSERRTYLMGHSMGSAGTFHLAVKYSGNWAATASIAPAAFRMDSSSLSAIASLPMMIVHGDADTAVPVAVGRTWAEAMKALSDASVHQPFQAVASMKAVADAR